MKAADKGSIMIRMVGGSVFLLVPAHPVSPGKRAIKRLLLLLLEGRPRQNRQPIFRVWH